ncbi:MAG: hypothetical protein PVG23_04050, partial [Nitrosopumilaceae archaeon]
TALIHQNGFLIDEEGNNIEDELIQMEIKIIEAKNQGNKEEERNFIKAKTELLKSSRKCVDLKNKILLFLDNPNSATYEMLKPIMSHDSREITFLTTKTDGSLSVKKSIIRNWPVFIFCSAKNEDKNEVWEEIKTRVFMTSPNSDITKYKEANKLTAKKFSRPSWGKEIYENKDNEKWVKFYISKMKECLTKLCQDNNNQIINPFDEIITEKFPHTQGVSMRHFARLMSFINLETLLNFENNPILQFETKEGQTIQSVFTTLDDIDNACKILKNISTISPEKIKFFKEIFEPLLDGHLDGKLTSSQLASFYTKKFGKPITVKQITENYLKPLVDSGVLSSEPNPSNTSQNFYLKASTITVENLENLKSTLIESSTPDLSYIDLCLDELEKVSTKFRKTNFIFRFNHDIVDLPRLKEILFGKFQKKSTLEGITP